MSGPKFRTFHFLVRGREKFQQVRIEVQDSGTGAAVRRGHSRALIDKANRLERHRPGPCVGRAGNLGMHPNE